MIGGYIAVGFVGLIGFVPEGGLGGVKGDHHALGLEAFAVIQQRLEEAVGHAGGNAVLGAQAPLAPFGEGVEAAEGQGMAIHQQQQRLGCAAHQTLELAHSLPSGILG